MRNNVIISSIIKAFKLLSPKQKKKSILIIIIVLINSVLDVFGLAAILPFVYIVSDPSFITENYYLNLLYTFLNFSSAESFTVFLIISLFFLFALKNIIAIYLLYFQSIFSFNIANILSIKLFEKYYNKGYLFFKNTNSNNLSTNIATVPMEYSYGILLASFSLISELFILALIVTGILIYDYKILLLLALLLLPVVFLFYKSLKKKLDNLGRDKLNQRSVLYKNLYESLHGYIDVKISGKQSYFFNRYFTHQKDLFNTYTKLYLYENSPNRIVEIAAFFGITLISVYSIYVIGNPSSLLPTLTLYIAASYRLMPSLNRILVAVMKIKASNYNFEILSEISSSNEPLEKQSFVPEEDLVFRSSIVFNEICFSYDKKTKHINNIDLEIKKGDSIGFYGHSGSGKTTFFNIILGLIKPDSGKIILDGKELSENETEKMIRLYGYVSQNYYLLDAPLIENIAFGLEKDKIDVDKVNRVIKLASLNQVVEQLPEGIYTNIGEHGGQLSGGQKQRIAIARALYFDKEIFLFDEATNALDTDTESEILDTIKVLLKNNKTVLIISHNYSTLQNCNNIFEISNGTIRKETI